MLFVLISCKQVWFVSWNLCSLNGQLLRTKVFFIFLFFLCTIVFVSYWERVEMRKLERICYFRTCFCFLVQFLFILYCDDVWLNSQPLILIQCRSGIWDSFHYCRCLSPFFFIIHVNPIFLRRSWFWFPLGVFNLKK